MDVPQKSIENLQLAWRCILVDHRDMMVRNSREYGPGLHMFKFVSPGLCYGERYNEGHGERHNEGHGERHNERHNCEYYFIGIDSDIWRKIGEKLSNYDPYKHYVVCVSVPQFDLGDERIESIRLFSLDDHHEVDI